MDEEFGQMLHAKRIEFIHPTKKELMIFSCETPKRFNEILQEYENH
jgi:23S rRNA-/tRNA-specific pseudouridylate synthase